MTQVGARLLADEIEAFVRKMDLISITERGAQHLLARAAAALRAPPPEAGVREALELLLADEAQKAKDRGWSDCRCIAYSREDEARYEQGKCPHQIARKALTRSSPPPTAGREDDYESEIHGVCAELYQIIGSLASEFNVFDHSEVQRALDNASEGKLVHKDLLPWPKSTLHSSPPPTAVAWRWEYHEDEAWQYCSAKYTPPREAISEPLGVIVASPPVSDASREALARWKHKKRGTTYNEIGRGRLQSNDPGGLTDLEVMVIYQGEDGNLWVRDQTEFEDGRFERLSPSFDNAGDGK